VGTVLLEAAEAWGRTRGARVARLDTYAHSPVSVPFYEDHMGYRRRSIVFQKRL
jgi:GNAT superfamily N-acetyltransferase